MEPRKTKGLNDRSAARRDSDVWRHSCDKQPARFNYRELLTVPMRRWSYGDSRMNVQPLKWLWTKNVGTGVMMNLTLHVASGNTLRGVREASSRDTLYMYRRPRGVNRLNPTANTTQKHVNNIWIWIPAVAAVIWTRLSGGGVGICVYWQHKRKMCSK